MHPWNTAKGVARLSTSDGQEKQKFPYAFLILLLFSFIFPHFLPKISPLGKGGSPTEKVPGYTTEHGQKEDHPMNWLNRNQLHSQKSWEP